jgi:exopolysaccharide biosynthesis polyprenyl glycosylphosphotransferase
MAVLAGSQITVNPDGARPAAPSGGCDTWAAPSAEQAINRVEPAQTAVTRAVDPARSALAEARRSAASESPIKLLLRHLEPTTWAYFDFVLVNVITWLWHQLVVSGHPGYAWVFGPWLSGLIFGSSITLAGLVFGLYERKTLCARSRILVRSSLTLGLGLILAYACILLFFYGMTSRWLGVAVGVLYAATALPLRLVAHEAVVSRSRRALCVGCEASIRKLVALLDHAVRPPVRIVGFVDVPPAGSEASAAGREPASLVSCRGRLPLLGALGEIDAVLARHQIDEVIVGTEVTARPEVGQAVLTCLDHRCRVTDQPTFVEKLLGEVPAENIDAQWFLLADVQGSGGYETAKRMVDVLTALAGLAVALVLWAPIALAIRLESRGPALFKQKRVGLHGRVFTIHKFRTMGLDAERLGARWADRNDPRVTRVGRWLRLTRLDELPQLWNVLRGDMSIVGPRPERPEFVEQLSRLIPNYRQRHLIKPGLSGWAQIHFGYGATVDDARRKLCFDLYYLKHRSIDLDFAILIRTLGTFLLGAR